MGEKRRVRKKTSIFRFFLVPLIGIMLVQSMITIGTLVVRKTAGMLQDYAGGMMSRLVENRKVILQNDMNQRWASVHKQEMLVGGYLKQILERENADLGELFESKEIQDEFLELLFPECLDLLQNSSTTGIFFVLEIGRAHV